jgi:hypothetical protein
MATRLKKIVVRQCERIIDGKTLMVRLEPGDMITMWEKGKRTAYTASLDKVFWFLAKQYAMDTSRREREEKQLKKDLRRDGLA